jgi:hypothetical protein
MPQNVCPKCSKIGCDCFDGKNYPKCPKCGKHEYCQCYDNDFSFIDVPKEEKEDMINLFKENGILPSF